MNQRNESKSAAAVMRASMAARGVIVRAFEPADMEAIAELATLPGVRHGTLLPPYISPLVTAERFSKKSDSDVRLCATVEGRLVGQLGLAVQKKPRRSHCAMLGIMVHDDYVGRGVGTALVAAAIECADQLLGLRRIGLTVFADNAPAIALYRKFGFVEEGRSRGFAMRAGKLVDALHMARLGAAPPFAQQ